MPALSLDRGLLGRALVNVIENALHAMRGGGTLTVVSRPVEGGAQIVVRDTGVGMEADALERLFEPYFSTKATGTGLGLTIAKRNVELNGGTIGVASAKGRGTDGDDYSAGSASGGRRRRDARAPMNGEAR